MFSPRQLHVHEQDPLSAASIRVRVFESSDPANPVLLVSKDFPKDGNADQILDLSGFFTTACIGKGVRFHVSEVGADGSESSERLADSVGDGSGTIDFTVTGTPDGVESAKVIV